MADAPTRVFFDGGCRPNPGTIEVAAVARGVVHIVEDLGEGDCLDAEWLALIHAVEVGQALGGAYAVIGDCRVVIDAAAGRGPCRGAKAQAHLARFLALSAGAPPVRIRWVRRAQNLAGIALNARHPR